LIVARPIPFARTDTSLVGRWWWTVDRWTLFALLGLIGIGGILALAASPAVAERIGLETFYFAKRQGLFLFAAVLVMLAASMLSPRGVRRIAVLTLLGAMVLMPLTLVLGQEAKGATRWIRIAGLSLQPSEFVKPALAVFNAWMLAEGIKSPGFPGRRIACGALVPVVGLLWSQPDFGMSLVVASVFAAQLFLAGISIVHVWAIAGAIIAGGVGAYFSFSHVQTRIDRFFDPAQGVGYQVARSMEAFRNGGLFGVGPGEGKVKSLLPDAHADFIMAVAGEEFGLLVCLIILGLFVFVLMRGFSRVLQDENLFVLLAVAGLLIQFGLQVLINLASTLALIPPKGMTLPFISYGGSSMLALSLAMGMVLALTRLRPRKSMTPETGGFE